MNIFVGVGRLVRDLEVSSSGKIAWSSVAIDRRMKDQDGNKVTDFIPVRFLGERAVSTATRFLSKGTKISFEGELQISQYKDKEGNNKSQTYVVVNNWEFAESKSQQQSEAPQAQPQTANDFLAGFQNVPDDISELPFS